MKPLVIAAAVAVVIALCVLVAGRVQSMDPTLTAAPPSGHPGQPLPQASPEKMARQQQVQAKMNAEIGVSTSSSH